MFTIHTKHMSNVFVIFSFLYFYFIFMMDKISHLCLAFSGIWWHPQSRFGPLQNASLLSTLVQMYYNLFSCDRTLQKHSKIVETSKIFDCVKS